ncbi:MAG: hypothetical protein ACLSS0_06775 [Clostridioides difficile]
MIRRFSISFFNALSFIIPKNGCIMRFEWFKYKPSGDIISISSVLYLFLHRFLIQAVCGSSPFSICHREKQFHLVGF